MYENLILLFFCYVTYALGFYCLCSSNGPTLTLLPPKDERKRYNYGLCNYFYDTDYTYDVFNYII